MKKLSKLKICLAVLAGVSLSSCEKDFDEINTNPNAPEDVPASVILPSVEQSAITRLFGNTLNLTYASTWAQHIAKIQYIDEDRYEFRPDAIAAHWDYLYAVPLYDAELIISKAVETENKSMEAVGRIMRAWVYQNMTDLWGDIPYSEALQGDEGNLTPVYDSQEAIYTDLLQQLETANTLLADGSGSIGGDLIYGGNKTLWRKFANSLRLRLLIHMADVAPERAKAGIEAIAADAETYPVFTSNDDNMELDYLTAQPYRNPWYENSVTRDDHGISKTMVDLLKDEYAINATTPDPRLPVYAKPAKTSGTYVGQPNGAATNPNISDISRIGEMYRDNPSQPMYIMTYSEVMFIMSEAAQRGWNVGITASEAYQEGIRANMELNGVEDSKITLYLAQPNVMLASQANKLEAISEQKWIALFGNGIEAFTELRRTGYPDNAVEPGGSAFPGRGIAQRFPYSTQELSVNRANVTAASQGVEDFLFGKKLWWDVN